MTSRAEVAVLVKQYTHLWGGGASVILPVPHKPDEWSQFGNALRRADPDVIILTATATHPELNALLSTLPAHVLRPSAEDLAASADAWRPLCVGTGQLPHPAQLLDEYFPTGHPDTTIRLIRGASPYAFELALHYGDPAAPYAQYLIDRMHAKELQSPDSVQQLLCAALISGARFTPRTVTTFRVSATQYLNQYSGEPSLTEHRADQPDTLFLFLDDGNSVHLPATFWNLRRVFSSNKVLAPRSGFLASLAANLAVLRQGWRFAELIIATPFDRPGAEDLFTSVKEMLDTLGYQGSLFVWYSGFEYSMPIVMYTAGTPETITRLVNDDGSVRFAPPQPPVHPDHVFAYDSTVDFSDGRKLLLPAGPWSTRLLLNDVERLRRAQDNESGLGALWLNRLPEVRTRRGGVSGTCKRGKEVTLFFHDDGVALAHFLAERNIVIKPNKLARHAAGFVRRFGGMNEAMRLVHSGALRILRVLTEPRADQDGLTLVQTVGLLARTREIDNAEATKLVKTHLPCLLEAGLVRRGVALRCKHCELSEWYPVGSMAEFVECGGCAGRFQLELGRLSYSFRVNELARRFVREGGEAVLTAALALRAMEPSGLLQFGGDLHRPGEAAPFAEIDLIHVSSRAVIIAECKTYDTVSETDIEQIRTSLLRNVSAAVAIGADAVILGLACRTASSHVHTAVASLADQVQPLNVGMHLLVNGQLFLQGQGSARDPRRIDVEEVKIGAPKGPGDFGIGTLRDRYDLFTVPDPAISGQIDTWEREFLQPRELGESAGEPT